jgi:hypothetical protein
MAPCPQDGVLTLCCCKPRIRLASNEGDWVIGFLPKRFGVGRIAWLGRISRKILLGDYQKEFPQRQDAIYRSEGLSPDGKEILIPLRSDYHIDSIERDRSGRFSLVFSPFWYFGGSGIVAPDDVASLAHYHIGQTTVNSSQSILDRLQEWASTFPEGILGTPRDPSLWQ